MKNYRFLAPILMVVIMVASWYMLISNAAKEEAAYNTLLTEARGFAADGLTKYAIEKYTLAIEKRSSPDLYKEVADYYKSQNKKNELLDWCELFLEEYPKAAVAYEYMLDAYVLDEDYKRCYDLINQSQKRGIQSDAINQVLNDIQYVYKLDISSYDDVGVYSNNFCAVNVKGYWGFVDRYGELRVSTVYPSVGAYTQSNSAPVVNQNGDTYYIDKTGSKVKVSKETYAQFGLLVGDIIAAKRTDGRYTYLNADLAPLFGDYDYASTMNNGVAAVKTGESWKLINSSGEQIGQNTYSDIKLDGKEIAFRNDRAFVSLGNGKYIMVDGSAQRIGSLEFEDAIPFMGDAPAAVKINGKWAFLNKDGNLISDRTYDSAKSYANGLAAVCIEGKWGFVDASENVVIEPTFDDAMFFNEKGSCFVKVSEKWKLLKLYRLNREE